LLPHPPRLRGRRRRVFGRGNSVPREAVNRGDARREL
jgi:hypothetical protein